MQRGSRAVVAATGAFTAGASGGTRGERSQRALSAVAWARGVGGRIGRWGGGAVVQRESRGGRLSCGGEVRALPREGTHFGLSIIVGIRSKFSVRGG